MTIEHVKKLTPYCRRRRMDLRIVYYGSPGFLYTCVRG